MPVPPSVPPTEVPLLRRRPRPRLQRILCLGLVPLFGLPLLAVGHGLAAPGGGDVAVRLVDGEPSDTDVTEPVSEATPAAPIRSLRRVEPTTTTTEAPTTSAPPTTVAPTTTSTTVAPTTTAPVRSAPPTTAAPAPTAPPTTAAPAPTAPPAPNPANTQSGQATWYRWKAGNCAHNTLPKGTVVTVTAVASGRTATCTVGDRGAFREPTIIDLDATVFEQIAPLGAGRIQVTISW